VMPIPILVSILALFWLHKACASKAINTLISTDTLYDIIYLISKMAVYSVLTKLAG